MNLKKVIKKICIPGGMVHEACQIQKQTGKSFLNSYVQAYKEYYTNDLPGTSHLYKAGKHEGEKQGRDAQAKVDAQKLDKMNSDYQKNLKDKDKIIKDQKDLLDDAASEMSKK